MPSEYSNYKELKEDVDSLKDKINKSMDDNKEIDKSIDNIRDLINKDEYTKAKYNKKVCVSRERSVTLQAKLQNKNLDENQKKTLEDLKGRVDSELGKSDENSSSSNKENSNTSNTNTSSTSKSDMALARIKYLNRLNDIQNQIDSMEPGDTTAEMNL